MKSEFRSWSDVRVFLAVLREGSTLAASRALGMAQPTVARRIDALEHELGVALFERDTRGFHPTEIAQALCPAAEAIETAASAFSEEVRDLSQPRPIRLTAFSENLSDRTLEIISEFLTKNPGVEFDFIRSAGILDIAANEADIAIRLSRTPQDPNLIRRLISTAQFTLYGSPEYARAHGLPASPNDMVGHKLLAYRRDDAPAFFYDWMLKYVPETDVHRRFAEVRLLDAAVVAGQGLAVMNLRLIEPLEKAGKIVRCFEPPEELDCPHMMLASPDAWRRPEVRAFFKFFAPRYAEIFK